MTPTTRKRRIERSRSVVLTISQMREAHRALRLIVQEDESAELNIDRKSRAAKRGAIIALETALHFTEAKPYVCECGHHRSYHQLTSRGGCDWTDFDYGRTRCRCGQFKPEGDFTILQTVTT